MTLHVSRHVSWGAKKTLNLMLKVFMVANDERTYKRDEWVNP